jgi:hypothetical protein
LARWHLSFEDRLNVKRVLDSPNPDQIKTEPSTHSHREGPLRTLGDKLGHEHEMIQPPTIITHIRSQLCADALPDWVSVIEGDVDYREFLRSKGVAMPDTAVAGGSMADGNTPHRR